MTDPHLDTLIGKISCTIQNIFIRMTGQFFVFFIIDMLDVQHNQIGVLQQLVKFGEKRLFSCKRLRGSIQRRIDVALMRFSEQINQKINLQKRLTAADGNAAFFAPVAAETFCLVQQFVCRHQVIRLRIPGIYVVAILAAHITSL